LERERVCVKNRMGENKGHNNNALGLKNLPIKDLKKNDTETLGKGVGAIGKKKPPYWQADREGGVRDTYGKKVEKNFPRSGKGEEVKLDTKKSIVLGLIKKALKPAQTFKTRGKR